MLFDRGVARVGWPIRWCAATAFAALLCVAGAAVAQEGLDNETPMVTQPPSVPAPVKQHHHKRRPPDDSSLGEYDPNTAGVAPPPPLPVGATPSAAPQPAPSPPAIEPPSIQRAPVPPSSGPTPPAAPPAPVAAAAPAGAPDSEPWSAAVLLERLCANNLRHNEEDRLYGLISFTVRSTLSYERDKFTAAQIDDTVQDALDALIGDCTHIVATDRAQRLDMVIKEIQGVALRRIADRTQPQPRAAVREGSSESAEDRRIERRVSRPLGKPTAADLSQELTSAEIDAWLDGLPPLQRALALFQYASDVTPQEIADALGILPMTLRKDVSAGKTSLLSFFREQEDGTPNAAPSPPILYREAGTPVAGLLGTGATPDRPGPALRITGISRDLYAGWSLLAVATGLPPDKSLDIVGPIMLATNGDSPRRLIAVATAEITKPDEPIRRFLLKAYTIDGDNGGAGYHDALHLVAGSIDNLEALKTLHTPDLSNIEIARCLWRDYGRGPDPGLCR